MVSYFATAMLAVGVLASTPAPVKWQADYGDALAATRADEKQPLLVVLDEPNGTEDRIAPALLGEGDAQSVDRKLLKHYHLCHVDVSTKYGKRIAGLFKAKRFPHVAIIDRSGKVILFKKSGPISSTEWTKTLEVHQDGERVVAKHISYTVSGDAAQSSTPSYSNNGYCPSCQRNRW